MPYCLVCQNKGNKHTDTLMLLLVKYIGEWLTSRNNNYGHATYLKYHSTTNTTPTMISTTKINTITPATIPATGLDPPPPSLPVVWYTIHSKCWCYYTQSSVDKRFPISSKILVFLLLSGPASCFNKFAHHSTNKLMRCIRILFENRAINHWLLLKTCNSTF